MKKNKVFVFPYRKTPGDKAELFFFFLLIATLVRLLCSAAYLPLCFFFKESASQHLCVTSTYP